MQNKLKVFHDGACVMDTVNMDAGTLFFASIVAKILQQEHGKAEVQVFTAQGNTYAEVRHSSGKLDAEGKRVN